MLTEDKNPYSYVHIELNVCVDKGKGKVYLRTDRKDPE